jgi:cytoskeletal protein RodZ
MNKAIIVAPIILIFVGALSTSVAFAQSDQQQQPDQSQKQQQQQPSCPSGYSLSSDGSTCTLDNSQSQGPSCPSGYSLSSDGKTCTSDQPSTPTCPSGYTLSSDQKTCTGGLDIGKVANGLGKIASAAQSLCTVGRLVGMPC